MKEFGYPPVFPEKEEKAQEESGPDPADPTKRVKKVSVRHNAFATTTTANSCVQVKSKVAAKGGIGMYQWEIMQRLDLSNEEILK